MINKINIKNKLNVLRRSFRLQIIFSLFLFTSLIAFTAVFTYISYADYLFSKEIIMNKNNTGIVLYDRNNKPFFTFYEAKNKEYLPLNKIPDYVQQAIIAVEDKDFYKHPGFSVQGIIRSIYLDIEQGNIHYGGSTITQQLVKNALLTPKKSILRKFQEVVLAQDIERRFSKDEILEMYLNSAYFGEGAFGIQQAAKIYYGKDANELNIAESALLAGLLPAPSKYSPYSGNRDAANSRQKLVLSKLEQQRYITKEEKNKFEKFELKFKKETADFNNVGAHFALMVRDRLLAEYGEETISRSGFKVKTTIDLEWQSFSENAISEQVNKLSASNVTNGASVVTDVKTGEVRALVGSNNWYNDKYGKVNIANTPRSPGSAFKPLIYAYALENKIITAATTLKDEPTTFQGNYKPLNYDRKWRGRVLTRRALANSLNVPAVEVMRKVGVESGLEISKQFGISTLKDPSNYGLSLVLGTGEVKLVELTNVYATFANNGIKNEITLIKEIKDKDGKTIFKSKPQPKQVISAGVAYIISSILSDEQARAELFGNVLNTTVDAAVKTGTGEDYKNAFTVGYTNDIAVGVWLGNNNSTPMGSIAGSIGPAPVWRQLIEKFTPNGKKTVFVPPSDVVQASICAYNGLLASTSFKSSAFTEYFLRGTQPTRVCSIPRPTNKPDSENKQKESENKNQLGIGGPDIEVIQQQQKKIEEEINKRLQDVQMDIKKNENKEEDKKD